MTKMLLKDLTAIVCGIIFAILCFAMLLHFGLFKEYEDDLTYEREQPETVQTNHGGYDYKLPRH